MPATAMPEASVIKVKGKLKSAKIMHFLEDNLFLAVSKHFCALSVQLNLMSFLFNLLSSAISSEKQYFPTSSPIFDEIKSRSQQKRPIAC